MTSPVLSRPPGLPPRRALAVVTGLVLLLAAAAATLVWLLASSTVCAPVTPTDGAASGGPGAQPRPTAAPTDSVDSQQTCADSNGLPAAAVTLGAVVLVGLGSLALARLGAGPLAASTPIPVREHGGDPNRTTLVEAVMYAADRTASTAIEVRLHEALTAAGVATVGAVGDEFDPRLHEAIGSAPAPSPQLDGVVAEVDRVGYLDGQTLVRPAQVTVFRGPA